MSWFCCCLHVYIAIGWFCKVTGLPFCVFAGLRKHDVCFVVTVKAQMSPYDQFDWNQPFVPQVGLAYVRGCEVEGMLDEEGRVIEEGPEPKPQLPGKSRTFRVWLDTNQYQLDMADVVQGKEDVYETFNIFMRRKPKENNFKVRGNGAAAVAVTMGAVRNLCIKANLCDFLVIICTHING